MGQPVRWRRRTEILNASQEIISTTVQQMTTLRTKSSANRPVQATAVRDSAKRGPSEARASKAAKQIAAPALDGPQHAPSPPNRGLHESANGSLAKRCDVRLCVGRLPGQARRGVSLRLSRGPPRWPLTSRPFSWKPLRGCFKTPSWLRPAAKPPSCVAPPRRYFPLHRLVGAPCLATPRSASGRQSGF